MANPLIPVIASAVLIGLAACSTPDIPEQVERPANELYDEALQLAKSGEPDKAAPKFEEVERQHPYSDLAVRALLGGGGRLSLVPRDHRDGRRRLVVAFA